MGLRSRVSGWVARQPAVAIGAFMSGIFLFIGLIGSTAFIPNMLVWRSSATWPTTDAEILASRAVYAMRGRTKRPDFTFRYEWKGQVYTAQGYDLLKVYTSNSYNDETQAVRAAHPVGSRTKVLVNPERPSQAVLTRGTTAGLVIHAVPPLFVVLGLIGAFFTTAAGLGWLDEKSRHPVGRVFRRFGRWFLQEKILKIVLFGAFGLVITLLVVVGIRSGNMLLVFVAAFFAWGLWRATRKRK